MGIVKVDEGGGGGEADVTLSAGGMWEETHRQEYKKALKNLFKKLFNNKKDLLLLTGSKINNSVNT